ncbi:TatD family hydrolase [Acidianus sp. RZ1]|uniref:TatD family hydrolase n=1 Tax=Acidianus sp. RZ1 TaxID=1540082 RepID=UPI001491BFE4|nr:TatD family hydrolase [Acidianus sp. RZ1]NON61576.1 TatD family hydrolase [Acidianus sp. RZ1]
MLFDAHCHLSLLKKTYPQVFIAAVSMDFASSLDTISLKSDTVLTGIGLHPWNANKENLEKFELLLDKADFIGEVGLDFKYSNADKDTQIETFNFFLERTFKKTINVHALEAWKEALDILKEASVERALLHWYSGPPELLKNIQELGYFISINPSVTFQEKHRKIAQLAPLEIIVTESDGGYEYKGKILEPTQINDTIDFLSQLKKIDKEEIKKIIEKNFKKLYNI